MLLDWIKRLFSHKHRIAEPLTLKERLARKQGYRCFYCDTKYSLGELTKDHVIPRVAGGKDTEENIVLACRECNTFKGDYVKRNGRLVRFTATREHKKKKTPKSALKRYRRIIAKKYNGI